MCTIAILQDVDYGCAAYPLGRYHTLYGCLRMSIRAHPRCSMPRRVVCLWPKASNQRRGRLCMGTTTASARPRLSCPAPRCLSLSACLLAGGLRAAGWDSVGLGAGRGVERKAAIVRLGIYSTFGQRKDRADEGQLRRDEIGSQRRSTVTTSWQQ